ncbi:MAG: hypothetical protein HUU21_32020 [Polyangiaceae bacterium]|nr:hypothetical protein [Polyangiaceae bacterium]
MSKWIIALMASFALLAGCGKKEGEGESKAKPASGESIGIDECDAYFAWVEACLGKVPPDHKTSMESAMKANRTAWKDIAKNADRKEALVTGCKATLDAFKTANPACDD